MFNYCNKLESLLDIPKWNARDLINLDGLFKECHSLRSLPDLSK